MQCSTCKEELQTSTTTIRLDQAQLPRANPSDHDLRVVREPHNHIFFFSPGYPGCQNLPTLENDSFMGFCNHADSKLFHLTGPIRAQTTMTHATSSPRLTGRAKLPGATYAGRPLCRRGPAFGLLQHSNFNRPTRQGSSQVTPKKFMQDGRCVSV